MSCINNIHAFFLNLCITVGFNSYDIFDDKRLTCLQITEQHTISLIKNHLQIDTDIHILL